MTNADLILKTLAYIMKTSHVIYTKLINLCTEHYTRNLGCPQEASHGELPGLRRAGDHAVPAPLHAAAGAGAGAGVLVLSVVERLQGEAPAPLEPPRRVDEPEGLEGTLHRLQVRCRRHPRVVDGDASVLVGVRSALRRDGILLVAHRLPHEDVAVLEDCHSVAEDEVDGAVDVAVAVELALGVHVERVLIALEAAAVEDGEVRAGAESHRLVLRRPRRVLEGDVPRDEPIADGR
ncbi:unnamed protein product [Spirodela intermedia]|uniref:Uncharacterized protein n=1 Tax=Spirodela intermedia TaxID=51605 RepID=A0A7I8J5T5_SPIIN|nr:unnamed protein product [Spirodela intermedia]CAA6664802.1 unnamed protein product [Spirodela intermedia]